MRPARSRAIITDNPAVGVVAPTRDRGRIDLRGIVRGASEQLGNLCPIVEPAVEQRPRAIGAKGDRQRTAALCEGARLTGELRKDRVVEPQDRCRTPSEQPQRAAQPFGQFRRWPFKKGTNYQ